MNGIGDGRRFEIPEGISPEEERAILMSLERYFSTENPKPPAWVLQGRIDATGFGALQVRRFAREPWHGQWNWSSLAFQGTLQPRCVHLR